MNHLSVEERAWLLGRLYRNISEYFAHWEDAAFTHDQMDNIYREWLDVGLKLDERRDFMDFLRKCMTGLRNGHSWCTDATAYEGGAKLGFLLEKIDGQWIVVDSEVPEVKVGYVMESIDGHTPDEWMKKFEDYLIATRPETRQTEWQGQMPTIWKADTAALLVRDYSDKICEVKYHPPKWELKTAMQTSPRDAHTEGKWLVDQKVGYIRIPSFNEPHFEEDALNYVQQFVNVRAIVIDVRNNGGGSTPAQLIAALMERPYRWWTETSPNVGYLHRKHAGQRGRLTVLENGSARWEGDYTQPESCIYRAKVIILANQDTGSAAEDLVMPFKDTGRATVIGKPTAGCTGQPQYWTYRDIHFCVGAIRAYMPSAEPFEGIGMAPDILVKRTREDLICGRDPVLQRALDVL